MEIGFTDIDGNWFYRHWWKLGFLRIHLGSFLYLFFYFCFLFLLSFFPVLLLFYFFSPNEPSHPWKMQVLQVWEFIIYIYWKLESTSWILGSNLYNLLKYITLDIICTWWMHCVTNKKKFKFIFIHETKKLLLSEKLS